MNFGEKLQSLRKNKGFSQEQLADQLNVSRQAVSKWETGDGYPELDKLIQISNLFGVSLDYLVKGESEVKEEVVIIEEPVIEEPIIEEKMKPMDFEEDRIRPISKEELQYTDIEEIEDYIHIRQQFAYKIGVGVMIIIVSVIFPIMLEFMETIAAAIMMLCIGLGVGLIIVAGINYSHVRKPDFILSVNDHSYFMAEFESIRSRFAKKISFGVFLILAGVAMTIIGEELLHNDDLSASFLFVGVGLAVYMFITAGIELGTYKSITGFETVEVASHHTHTPRSRRKRLPIAESSVIIYLILGFVFHLWHPGWIIFPILGIVDGMVNNN